MEIFPTSPVWADITREVNWAEEVYRYDSGARQGATPWERPLYTYNVRARNFNELKQNSLHVFVNSHKGMVTPFLFKDPYDYTAQAVTLGATTAMGAGSGFYLTNEYGWAVIPDSAFLTIVDGRSGTLNSGSHYVASLDNGWVEVQVAVSSVWTSSFEFFRKAAFARKYTEQSNVWNNFSATLVIEELIPNVS